MHSSGPEGKKRTIFISHSSADKEVTDMLLEFFSNTGVSRDNIFCSSAPGSDVDEKISEEIKGALESSLVNIIILSNNFYQSAYCMNEAGIIWYLDVPKILIALPEIDLNNMRGFLNAEYRLHRLDVDDDITHIYDRTIENTPISGNRTTIVASEGKKLTEKYSQYLSRRNKTSEAQNYTSASPLTGRTDDECVLLYYILQKQRKKVSKFEIVEWLHEEEIRNVDIDNAFNLLSADGNGTVTHDELELSLESFRNYLSESKSLSGKLTECINRHRRLSADRFDTLWRENAFDIFAKLLLAYIVDENASHLGARWKAENQIKSIVQWEYENSFQNILSSRYEKTLQFFVDNELVYASEWTRENNPREYTVHRSLFRLLTEHQSAIGSELKKIKEDVRVVWPADEAPVN